MRTDKNRGEKIPTITNKDVSRYIYMCDPFINSSKTMFGVWVTTQDPKYATQNRHEWDRHMYVVCSYGWHYPLGVFETRNLHWYVNSDVKSPSRTTAKHMGMLRDTMARGDCSVTPIPLKNLVVLMEYGFKAMVDQRVADLSPEQLSIRYSAAYVLSNCSDYGRSIPLLYHLDQEYESLDRIQR